MTRGFEPNPGQRKAIETLDGDLVISAGAGSGKTAVLARRFARAVLGQQDGREPIEMAGVLTITFTRKAASELAERIRRVLLEDPGTGLTLSRRTDDAWISTIDGFCARIVRRHAIEAGVDPVIRYADEIEAGLLQSEAARSVIVRVAGTEHGGPLVKGMGRTGLEDSLRRDLARLRSMGRTPEDIELSEPPDIGEPLGELARCAQDLIAALEAMDVLKPTHESNLETARQLLLVCSSCSEPVVARHMCELLSGRSLRGGVKPKEETSAAKEAFGDLMDALADHVIRPYAEAYRQTLIDFGAEYSELKASSGLMDFADAVEIAARLIGETGPLHERYARQFRLVMVDEFQDTNELQMLALGPIARGRLCAVGDVQQSIYGFRYADVDVMRGLAETADARILLPTNYRSHPGILSFVNEVFAREEFLGEDFLELQGARTEFRIPWDASSPRVELVVADTCSAGPVPAAHVMAQATADRIAGLTSEGVAARDIVVLMRSMRHAATVAGQLESRGVPAHVASGEALFDRPVVADVRALLKVIVTPDDDGALFRVLAGPFCGLDDDALAATRFASRHVAQTQGARASLYDGLREIATSGSADITARQRTLLAEAFGAIEALRKRQCRLGVASLLHAAVHLFDLDLTLLASGCGGAQAWSDVRKLIRLAEEYERRHAGDVGGFLGHLDSWSRYAPNEPASPPAVPEDAVRIMSIHSAKGLEFPVVVVAGLEAALTKAERDTTLVERVDGRVLLSMRHPSDGSPLEKTKDSRYARISEHRKRLQHAEEMRVLYVACTRAEEALVLVGACDPARPSGSSALGALLEPLGGGVAEGDHVVGSARVGVRVFRSCEGEDSPRVGAEAGEDAPNAGGACRIQTEKRVLAELAVFEGVDEEIETPTRVSYSSLNTYAQCPYRFWLEHAAGLRKLASGGRGAVRVGSAFHEVIEMMSTREYTEVVEVVVRRHSLDEEASARVRQAVEGFLRSETGRRVAEDVGAHREQPFEIDLGEVRLVGKMDAWLTGSDGALVVDYKTGRDRAASRRASRLAGYALQADCYALAVLRSGVERVEVRFVFVEQGCEEVVFQHDSSGMALLEERVGGLVERIVAGEFPHREAFTEEACSDCPGLGGLCPIDPLRRSAG